MTTPEARERSQAVYQAKREAIYQRRTPPVPLAGPVAKSNGIGEGKPKEKVTVMGWLKNLKRLSGIRSINGIFRRSR